MTWPTQHLTIEDLDAFHSESLPPEAQRHLLECDECRTLVERDRELVARLEALPVFSPRADLADRVLAQLARPAAPAPVPVRTRRVALAASVLIAAGASVVWSLENRALLGSWVERGTGAIRDALWEGIATASQNLAGQSWIAELSRFGTGRLAGLGLVLLVGYAAGLLGLRRLLTAPVAVSPSNR
jgi:hypothetical protein